MNGADRMLLLTVVPCPVNDCSRCLDLRSLSRGHGGLQMFKEQEAYQKSNLLLEDILLFIKSYLERNSLVQCSRFFRFFLHKNCRKLGLLHPLSVQRAFLYESAQSQIEGNCKIDKSLFDRRIKFESKPWNEGNHFQVSISIILL